MNTKLQKPNNVGRYDLIAILGVYDTPKNVRDLPDMTYSKSEIAYHELSGKVQAYVFSNTLEGLNDFKEDYPDAVVVESAVLENPEEWKQLAFPSESVADDATPLDRYFQARGRELSDRIANHRRNKQK